MLGSSQREGERKEEWDGLKGTNLNSNLPQVKQFSPRQWA